MLKNLFSNVKTRLGDEGFDRKAAKARVDIPADLWVKCSHCGATHYGQDFEKELWVCPKCGFPARLGAQQRLQLTVDEGTFQEMDAGLTSANPLHFEGYEKRIEKFKAKTGLNEAVLSGTAEIDGQKCVIAIMDSRFFMGSMGCVVGEKITRAFEAATAQRLPIVIFSASGGARMQEGMLSLMQMAKTSAAAARHNRAGLLYVCCMTDPTTGGVSASFASLADIIVTEPHTLIGFAGKRVIEGTIKQKLPDDFQSAEFMLAHGHVDRVIPRREMKEELGKILRLHNPAKEVHG
ncbi:MAG: acetyl-CoA carboxylase, carboxyltransferase subunit beta [Eubacteriales bacterium]|jgi:acetyl-CoA carboxylase carboxyl transferase subunit beta